MYSHIPWNRVEIFKSPEFLKFLEPEFKEPELEDKGCGIQSRVHFLGPFIYFFHKRFAGGSQG